MAFTLEPVSLISGALIVLFVWIIIYLIYKLIKIKKEVKTSLPTMKKYIKDAHNHMVESANNLVKLYEVFNEIEESKQ